MRTLASVFRDLEGRLFVDEDGEARPVELLPPASRDEIAELQSRLPAPIPDDVVEGLEVAKGLVDGPIHEIDLVDLDAFWMEDVFPHPHSVAHDGFGNFWLIDLLPGAPAWGPVFYACHDPPVIAYQSPTIADFVWSAAALELPDVDDRVVDMVHEEITTRLWTSSPGLIVRDEAAASGDEVLRSVSETLEAGALIADLRDATVGDGFSWGRFGPRTRWRRHGTHRVWSTEPPPGCGARLRGMLGLG